MDVLESIKKTIEYSQKFDGALTEEQLWERLITEQIYSKDEIEKIVEKTPKIKKQLRTQKESKLLEEKIKKAKELTEKISKKFKNILLLGISGSVAADYPKKNDDIDLIIITKINKLWITRLRLRWFILINKIPHRKFGKKEKRDDFCFNLWLDEKTLELDPKKQNLKNAMDLILMKPLINRKKTYEKFILANNWAKKYVATGYNEKIKSIKMTKNDDLIKRNDWLNKGLNYLVFWPQFWYMKKRIQKEKVGLHEAFFHH